MKNSYNSTTEKQTPDFKISRGSEQTFFQRRNTDGQQAHEKMFNIADHQSNENQNHNEVTPHTCRNGYHQKVYK